ncbi:hypothetical protein ACQKMV_05210 [Lysinibacillus sp. NPDC094403]|uniref:hypothetical protein n=1 Tax=Lysinibacillus sp. NPDC094403 TaxID=3390581 RepID=UPI003CFCBA4A
MTYLMLCGEMAQEKNKIFQLFGNIAGEMRIEDVPTAPGVDVNELKKGDDDPLEVIVEIPASKSKRGWNYTANSLKNIVDAVNTQTLNGFLGHQKAEDVSNQFLPPVTHWVGAKMVGEIAFFRGIVDASAKDLKRWIRSKRIRQVSIFGIPKLQRVAGETNVIGYEPMSIDWTPLDRAGMNTRIVAMSGEMWDLEGEGPTGEMEYYEGGAGMKPEDVLNALKEMLGNKQITFSMIAGEMGLKPEQIASDIDADWVKNLTESVDKLQKVEEALGVSGEMDVVALANEAAKALKEQGNVGVEKIIGEMIDTKIQSENVRKDILNTETAIGKLWSYHSNSITADMTKDQIASEMDSFLNDGVVKNIISAYHTEKHAGLGNLSGNANTPQGLKTKRTAL